MKKKKTALIGYSLGQAGGSIRGRGMYAAAYLLGGRNV